MRQLKPKLDEFTEGKEKRAEDKSSFKNWEKLCRVIQHHESPCHKGSQRRICLEAKEFLKLLFLYSRGREIETSQTLVDSAYVHKGGAGLDKVESHSVQVSYAGGRNPPTRAITAAPQGMY